MAKYDVAEAFIELLNANGVETVFFNPGIDNIPVLKAMSEYSASSKQTPREILCLDESVAMSAAHGNYMVSGRPQVVMVHSELGTLQLGGPLHNAQWGRIPVIIFAESLGPAQRKNWLQEPFKQGIMVRNLVKWDHHLGNDEDIVDAVQQAFRIATTEPCGPVYLSFPREIFTKKIDTLTNIPAAGVAATSIPQADVSALSQAAEILISAEDPLIIAGYSGRNPQAVASLVALAETLCARVVTAEIRMNFPNTHPLLACTDTSDGSRDANPYLSTSDVILVIDYDIPYAPPRVMPGPEAKIIHIDIEPIKRGVPLWGRRPDILIKADSSQAIPALNEIIRQRLTPEQQSRFHERFKRLESEHKELRSQWYTSAISQAKQTPISPDWFCHCLDEITTDDTIILNQTITPSLSVVHQIQRTKPGTMLACSGGSIGWALGAALGAKLAAPHSTVVSLMGDGAFIFGCPMATLWSASYYQAPFLSIIFNNHGYAIMRGLFPGTGILDKMGADITPPPDYALVAQACYAYGRTVVDPAEVPHALREAIDQVHNGRPAVLDVRLESV